MAPKSPFNPLDTIALQSPTHSSHSVEFSPKVGPSRDPEAPVKRWYHYLPLCGAVLLILAPQPSWLYVLLDYHLKTIHRPGVFLTHLLVSYTLTFLIFSALIVCVARDPGPVMLDEPGSSQNGGDADDAESEALMDSSPLDDYSAPGRWCRKCWGPKPERAHHCSICGRCVLKMDHHCPWLGAKCIGHRTYPAFLHFLLCITLLSIYIAAVCSTAVWDAFEDPLHMNELMPLHAIFLTFYAVVFTLVMGSFYCYHLYLVFINQTTIENLSPFLILRHLPPLPPSPPSPSATAPPYHHTLSSPPLEPELSRAQRHLVQDAHGHIRIYDLGWRRNFAQVFGFGEGRGRGARGRSGGRDERGGGGGRWRNWKGWVGRVWFGGSAPGDGRTFPRNPRSEELLARLASELVKAEYR